MLDKNEVDPRELTPEDLKGIPVPTGYRLLIIPYSPPKTTKSGIIVTDKMQQAETVASTVGYVVKIGPDCYKDKSRYPEGPWCAEGDFILFGRYAGARIQRNNMEMRILNDDEVLANIDEPKDYLAY
jgi:co-chaperonin GroES (HSP10)